MDKSKSPKTTYYLDIIPNGLKNAIVVFCSKSNDTFIKGYKTNLDTDGYTYCFDDRVNKKKNYHAVSHRSINESQQLTFLFDGADIWDLFNNEGISIKNGTGRMRPVVIRFNETEKATMKLKTDNKNGRRYIVKYDGEDLEKLFFILFSLSKLQI